MEEKKTKRYIPVIILLVVFGMLTVALIGQNFWFGRKTVEGEMPPVLTNAQ